MEKRSRLIGGKTFQGSVLPHEMWDRRLTQRPDLVRLHLWGETAHPAASAVGLNGCSAAFARLVDPGWGPDDLRS